MRQREFPMQYEPEVFAYWQNCQSPIIVNSFLWMEQCVQDSVLQGDASMETARGQVETSTSQPSEVDMSHRLLNLIFFSICKLYEYLFKTVTEWRLFVTGFGGPCRVHACISAAPANRSRGFSLCSATWIRYCPRIDLFCNCAIKCHSRTKRATGFNSKFQFKRGNILLLFENIKFVEICQKNWSDLHWWACRSYHINWKTGSVRLTFLVFIKGICILFIASVLSVVLCYAKLISQKAQASSYAAFSAGSAYLAGDFEEKFRAHSYLFWFFRLLSIIAIVLSALAGATEIETAEGSDAMITFMNALVLISLFRSKRIQLRISQADAILLLPTGSAHESEAPGVSIWRRQDFSIPSATRLRLQGPITTSELQKADTQCMESDWAV